MSATEGSETPNFDEPWQAELFALTTHLSEAGLFSWSEWTETFGPILQETTAAEDGSDYYERWLRALETLLHAKAVTSGTDVDRITAAWQRAAHATPHGNPILLENDPQRGAR